MTVALEASPWRPRSRDPAHAFDTRRPVGGRNARGVAVPVEDSRRWWREEGLASTMAQDRLAFVSVPFCSSRCLFCPFYANADTQGGGDDYLELLSRELSLDLPRIDQKPFDAVYFGAGTPSDLPEHALEQLIRGVVDHLPLAVGCEVSLEGRPASLDARKLALAVEAGVTRVSLGIQSFDTALRRQLGRRLDDDDCVAATASLRNVPGVTLVADLLLGLPGQDVTAVLRDIDQADRLGLDGLTLYVMSVMPKTPLERRESRRPGWLPPLSSAFEQYMAAAARLEALGWRQVSNSHWARTPRETARYNLAFKRGAPTFALGSRAGGGRGPFSYRLTMDLKRYREQVLAGIKPIETLVRHPGFGPAAQALSGEMDVGRVGPADWPITAAERDRFAAAARPLLEAWEETGLVRVDSDGFELTPAGRFWEERLTGALLARLPADENAQAAYQGARR